MKVNSKRKVFGDAVDLLMGDMEEVTMPKGVQMVPVKSKKVNMLRLEVDDIVAEIRRAQDE